ncbi:multiple sugar transport system substrate-binding protein [Lentzea fradiae]|uniref:Multiple sugar transport system substrate-binding protein n=1 Tax=Lentzea fradiae TaxID=200378 RepID=A0A1G7S674_9PSEU|nr:sugar ABC transporter substrate-binding protein [Lentzea fradiae]SDG18498.1 multiple sugar transport system substrate-binding protein [Lentzea fradiae]
MKRRTFLAGMVAVPVAGCGLSGTSNSGSSAGGQVTGEITFQTWSLKPKYTDYVNGVIDAFQQQHQGTTVKWVDQPADGYLAKVMADASAGTLPDVINVPPDLSFPLAKAGQLVDLDEVARDAKPEYLENAWQAFEIPGQGGCYGFPWYLNTGPLFYNKALFRQAGLDPDKPPANFDELEQYALKLAEKNIAILGQTPSIADFGLYGVKLFENGEFTFNEPKGVELVESYKRMYDAGALIPEALTQNYTGAGTKFMAQQTAMNPGSAYDLGKFKTDAPSLYANIGITTPITNTGSANMFLHGVSVPKSSKNQATALAFGRFVTNAANQVAFAKLASIFPSTTKGGDDPYFTTEDGSDEARVRVAAAKQLKTAVNYTPVQFSDQMREALLQQLADAMLGKKSPKEALDAAVEECNRLLK